MAQSSYDVAIVGASISGCTAAILFARNGAKVALIERERDPGAYKKVCTHFIQSSALPTIERLGLAPLLEAAGAVRNDAEVWTRWGWILPTATPLRPRPTYGYSIRREKLDPMLRRLAANTAGVELLSGMTAQDVVLDDGRVSGVAVSGADMVRQEIRARLVVAADGRHTRIADLAGLPGKPKRHGRFAYFAYYRDLPLKAGSRSQLWLLEPDVAYIFPNDDNVTIAAAMPVRAKLSEWKADPEGSLQRLFEKLPNAPSLHGANRVSPVLGMLEMPDTAREVAKPGLALVGDAALSADPLWGVGCGWAFQSAEWLADAVGSRFQQAGDIDPALTEYRRRHRRQLAGHEFLIADFATGRGYNPIEKLIFSAATRDPVCADHFFAFGSRNIGVGEFLAPRALARAAWVNLRHMMKPAPAREPASSTP